MTDALLDLRADVYRAMKRGVDSAEVLARDPRFGSDRNRARLSAAAEVSAFAISHGRFDLFVRAPRLQNKLLGTV